MIDLGELGAIARDLLDAERRAAELRVKLTSMMTDTAVRRLDVADMGSVTYVGPAEYTSLDSKACEARLRELGEPVPVVPRTRSAGLRLTLAK